MFSILLPLFFTTFTTAYHVNGCKTKEYFDLGYTFSSDTIYYPGQKQFELHKDTIRLQGNGYAYSAYSISMAEHGGTHIDAPFHFNAAGWTVDKIPQNHLIDVPATIIDVSKAVNDLAQPSKFLLEVQHIIEHEIAFKTIPFGGVVLVYTGWSKYWPDKIKYLGWDNTTDVKGVFNSPGISTEAAKWLVNERHIVGIGLDTASIDAGDTQTFSTHVVLADNQIFNLENVANLHLLLNATKHDCSLRLFVTPIKIVGGTGAPTSILAYCKD